MPPDVRREESLSNGRAPPKISAAYEYDVYRPAEESYVHHPLRLYHTALSEEEYEGVLSNTWNSMRSSVVPPAADVPMASEFSGAFLYSLHAPLPFDFLNGANDGADVSHAPYSPDSALDIVIEGS